MMPLQAFEVMVNTKRWRLQFFFIPESHAETSRFTDGEASHIYGGADNFSSAFVKPNNSNTNLPLKTVVEKMNRTIVKVTMLEHASFEWIFHTEVPFTSFSCIQNRSYTFSPQMLRPSVTYRGIAEFWILKPLYIQHIEHNGEDKDLYYRKSQSMIRKKGLIQQDLSPMCS